MNEAKHAAELEGRERREEGCSARGHSQNPGEDLFELRVGGAEKSERRMRDDWRREGAAAKSEKKKDEGGCGRRR